MKVKEKCNFNRYHPKNIIIYKFSYTKDEGKI